MICLEVWVNGEKICLAGVGDGVLHCIVDAARRRFKSHLHVGGLIDNEHVRWTQRDHFLEVGDEVTIKIVEADAVDEPVRKHPRKKE